MSAPDDAIDGLLAAARAAWPALVVAPEAFRARVAASAASGEVAVADLRGPDLYLAVACEAGVPAALTAFEALLAPIGERLRRAGHDHATVDEALQLVRFRTLVATPARPAKLASYRGHGSLAGWLRVVALREVFALLPRRGDRSDAALATAAAADDGPLALLARVHGPAVRRMFRAALAALEPAQRALLRLEIVDGLAHERIAELHGVHRTTALRWIAEARAALAHAVRRQIKRELHLDDGAADSLLRALAGQVELSLTSGLLTIG